MNRQPRSKRPASSRGFTLLEMCIVLCIIALLAGLSMPALNSAFRERTLRNDAHALSLMVKTAMIKSGEEQRPYLIVFDGKGLQLEPEAGNGPNDPAGTNVDAAPGTIQSESLENNLKFPDANKRNTWESLPAVTWKFMPNDLCPMPRVRIERGDSYIEMSFNALTGNVVDEAYYLP